METKIRKRFEKVEKRVEKIEKFIESGLSKKGKLVKCKCGYSWISKTKKDLVSCPSCGNKVRINEKSKEELVKKGKKEIYAEGKSWGEVAKKNGII